MFTQQATAEELRIDEEIRLLEMKKNLISNARGGGGGGSTPPSYHQQDHLAPPQYPLYSSFQPPISFNPYQYQAPGAFMMMPPQQQQQPPQQPQQQQQSQPPQQQAFPPMFQPPSYPQGYFIPPYMGPPPPYAFPPQFALQQQPPAQQPPPQQQFDASMAAAASDLDKLKQFAVEKNDAAASAASSANQVLTNLGQAVGNALVFGAQMAGSSALVLARDLLDTTKERTEPGKVTVQHLQRLEEDAVAHAVEHIHATTPDEKQKIKKLKSVRQLLKAKSVNEVVMGLKNSGREDEAEALARRVLALRRQMYGDAHEATSHALNQLASVLARKQQWQEAEDTYSSALSMLRLAQAGDAASSSSTQRSSPQLALREAMVMHNLACIKLKQQGEGKVSEALALGRDLVELCSANLGDAHERTVHYKRMWQPGFHAAHPAAA